MKSTHKLLSAMALGAAMTLPVHAQTPAAKPVQVMDVEGMSKLVNVTAVVQAVDQKNRVVTLTGPEGNTFSVLVDPAVKNLPQVKAGDSLVVEYYESLALDFQKGDGIRVATTFDDSARAKAGNKPGAAALSSVTLVTNIWALNPAKGLVTVRGPYGHFTEVRLKDPSMLSGVKVGDQMKLSYTQAVAVGIQRP
jgi:hypothetical protein